MDIEYLNEFADINYSLDNELALAYKTVERLKSKQIFLSDSFEDDIWLFANEYAPGRIHRVDFTNIDITTETAIPILKCWLGHLLDKYRPKTCVFYFGFLKQSIILTDYFSTEKLYSYIEWLHSDEISDNHKFYTLLTVFNFLDYSEIENSTQYIPKLIDFKNKIRFRRVPRVLPKSSYIMSFSYYLEKYFKDLNENNEIDVKSKHKRKILFYPLLLWWKVTNIIPMRGTEFCLIERNCLVRQGDRMFLKLPRIKQPLVEAKHTYTIDAIEINEQIYELIQDYIESTEDHGHTKSLVSYPSLIYADYTNQREKQKRNPTQFNINNLEKLLQRFYKRIINNDYNFYIPQNQKLSPNDTRHLAFISLLMQGITPVEIARLGGHKTIKAQYHYSFHTEYWIDNEVFKLMKNFKSIQQSEEKSINFVPDFIKLKAFQPPTSDFKGKLEIGYCSDALQRCESSECMLCSHWRIDPNDLNKEHSKIKHRINQRKNNLTEIISFIKHMHDQLLSNQNGNEDYTNTGYALQISNNQVKSELDNIASLKFIEGGSPDD